MSTCSLDLLDATLIYSESNALPLLLDAGAVGELAHDKRLAAHHRSTYLECNVFADLSEFALGWS